MGLNKYGIIDSESTMKSKTFAIDLIYYLNLVFGSVKNEEHKMSIFPDIFNISDLESCPKDYFYCKIHVILRPQNEQNPSKLWMKMKKENGSLLTYYRRDLIYRTICVQSDRLEKEYNEYIEYGLEGRINESYCFEIETDHILSFHDICLLFVLSLYILFLTYCTLKSNKMKSCKESCPSRMSNRYMRLFSATNTLREIFRQSRTEKSDKFLFIQGIRTLAMCMIILTHSLLAKYTSFIYNPEYIEQLNNQPLPSFMTGLLALQTQIFFTISAWLLAVQLSNIVEKNKTITMVDIFCVLQKRYFRFIPLVIVIILLHSSPSDGALFSEPLHRSLIRSERIRCRKGWWRNLLFIQNWNFGEFCSPGTWYLAADTQLYVLSSLLFYISHRLRISINYIGGFVIAGAVCLQGTTVMTTNFEGLLRYNPRIIPTETHYMRPEYTVSYSGTICNLAPYVTVFLIGTLYAKKKNCDFVNTVASEFVWRIVFLCLPLISAQLYNYHSSRIIETVMALTLRPLFSSGIAIGFLGMATNTGGFIKNCLEWRPLVFLGNSTYSVYMFHFLVVFSRLSMQKHMVHFGILNFLNSAIIDIAVSFSLGLIMYILLEYPCCQILPMLLPQLKIRKETLKDKVF